MKKYIKKALFLSLSILLLCANNSHAAGWKIYRIAGKDRYETSTKISRGYKSSKIVLIASGENYPDALFAGSIGRPILLVKKDYIPESVINEIARLKAKEIYVIGGKSSISDDVILSLEIDTGKKVTRIAGRDRIETAREVEKLRDSIYKKSNFYLAPKTRVCRIGINAYNFYDALYAVPIFSLQSGIQNNLSNGSVDKYTTRSVVASNPSVNDGDLNIAVGDINISNHNGKTTLIRGSDRYHSSAIIAKNMDKLVGQEPYRAMIVSGENYPDGLCASCMFYFTKDDKNKSIVGVLLLTEKNRLSPYVEEYLRTNTSIEDIFILGGENTISKDVENQIRGLRQ